LQSSWATHVPILPGLNSHDWPTFVQAVVAGGAFFPDEGGQAARADVRRRIAARTDEE
jgi:hypothetical protein